MEEISETVKTIRKMGYLAKLHKAAAEKNAESGGLALGQILVVGFLANHDAQSQKQIAEHFNVSKPAITVMVARLEELGLVRRTEDPNDGRLHLVSLTDRGMKVAMLDRSSFRAMNERMAEGITEADMKVFSRVLDKMIGNLEKEN